MRRQPAHEGPYWAAEHVICRCEVAVHRDSDRCPQRGSGADQAGLPRHQRSVIVDFRPCVLRQLTPRPILIVQPRMINDQNDTRFGAVPRTPPANHRGRSGDINSVGAGGKRQSRPGVFQSPAASLRTSWDADHIAWKRPMTRRILRRKLLDIASSILIRRSPPKNSLQLRQPDQRVPYSDRHEQVDLRWKTPRRCRRSCINRDSS